MIDTGALIASDAAPAQSEATVRVLDATLARAPGPAPGTPGDADDRPMPKAET